MAKILSLALSRAVSSVLRMGEGAPVVALASCHWVYVGENFGWFVENGQPFPRQKQLLQIHQSNALSPLWALRALKG